MGKRSIIILLIVLFSCLVILGYFMRKNRNELLTDPYKVISQSTAVLIETADLQGFLNLIISGNSFLEELVHLEEFSDAAGRISYISDMAGKPGFKRISGSGNALIAFQVSERARLEALLAIAVPADVRMRQIADFLREEGNAGVTELAGANDGILGIPFKGGKEEDTLCLALMNGVLVCSTSASLLGKALLQPGLGTDIRDNKEFRRIFEASGKKADKLFILPGNLGEMLKNISADRQFISETVRAVFEGDIIVTPETITLSGYSETPDSSSSLGKYKSAAAGVFTTYRILPASVAMFATMAPQADYNPLLKDDNGCRHLAAGMSPYIGKEISKVIGSDGGQGIDANRMLIYRLTDPAYAAKVFTEALSGDLESGRAEVLRFRPDDQVDIPVYHVAQPGFGEYFFGDFSSWRIDTFFTFYDDFLVTGGSYEAVAGLLYNNILNKTLANDLTYREFESSLPTVSAFCLYLVPGKLNEYIKTYLGNDIREFFETNTSLVNKIEAAGYQLAPSNNMIYNSISVRFGSEERKESAAEWQTKLDTVASIKPFFFTNHNTGAREIFIQDMKNNAYLINSAGRVLWKVPLSERIIGQVFMIDYFRNGKYQLLFSGTNYLHLLDRNGNYVERYPVKLRAPATAPMALFDYDNNMDYRIFIPGNDRVLYAYDKTGSVVRGWRNYKTPGPMIREVSWLRVSGKDYLIAADDRSLYFLDRTGNTRIRLSEQVSCARNSAVRLSTGGQQSVVCTAPDGTVQHIYFDGTVRKFRLNDFSIDHSFDLFDIDGDGFGEYVFIDRGMLYLYDNNRTEMFIKEFGSGNLAGPINFVFSSSDRKIGLFDPGQKLIYLVGRDGETMKGFPLKGASLFSIGKLSDRSGWNLIVGGTDSFLYNYKLSTIN